MKPSFAIVTDINISIAEVINHSTRWRSLKPPSASAVSAHILRLFFLFFIGSSVCHATLVLTACSASEIVIAADGLQLKPGGTPPFVPGCKIIQGADRCFFSIVGVQDIKSIKYDLVPLAKRVCNGRGPIVKRANVFEKSTLPEVQRAWQHIKAHEPASYAVMRRSGPARVSIVFASGENPFTVVIVQYTEDASGNMAIDKQFKDISNFASLPLYEQVGASENTDVYRRKHPEIEKLNGVGFLRSMLVGAVDLETAPKRIGQPIAILQITPDGAKWIEQGACADIKHYPRKPHSLPPN